MPQVLRRLRSFGGLVVPGLVRLSSVLEKCTARKLVVIKQAMLGIWGRRSRFGRQALSAPGASRHADIDRLAGAAAAGSYAVGVRGNAVVSGRMRSPCTTRAESTASSYVSPRHPVI